LIAARVSREPIRIAAPAKLNLYLHVTGRRPDGYHELDSLIAFAGVHDTLEITNADALHLELAGPFGARLASEPDNLVLRAARALAEAASVPPHAALRLIKRLPPASGIGGGSADAAAALRGLARLWHVALPEAELARLGLALGADLPACLHGRAAFAGGVGERLEPAPALPPAGLLLVNPGIPLATAAVFKARRGALDGPARFSEPPGSVAALAACLADRRNALADAAIALCPPIAALLATLADLPGCRLARMSGSGATCYGLFDDEAAAAAAAIALNGKEGASRSGWWIAATRLLSDATALPAD
jgi:4-diphosphocytidyl-2-C-methyl-D-erythritol kinase